MFRGTFESFLHTVSFLLELHRYEKRSFQYIRTFTYTRSHYDMKQQTFLLSFLLQERYHAW